MKNIGLILACGLVLLLPNLALATSGACSGHGGVSCSAGPDSDGSVICVDGWRNSSVLYSSMVKCGGSSPALVPVIYTPPPESTPAPQPEPPPTTKTPEPVTTNIAPKESEPEPVVTQKSASPQPVRTTTPTPSLKTVSVEEEKLEPLEISSKTAIEPPTPIGTIIALGILGGMGYGGYRGVKFIGKKFVSLLKK